LMDPDEFGAVPLLGLDGLVFIGHGRSDAKALVSAVNQVKNAVKAGLLPSLRSELNLEKIAE
jgi:glycerol-3-phosphate acyltransferase PlsX